MDTDRTTEERVSEDRLQDLINLYDGQAFRGDTVLALQDLQRLRHYVATCGGTENDGRCPMHHLAGVSPEPRGCPVHGSDPGLSHMVARCTCFDAPEPGGRPKDGEPYVGPAPILLGIGKVRVAICSDTDDPMRVARELVIYDDGDGPKPVGTPEPEHAGKRADQVGKVLARLRVMNAKGAMVFADDLMTVIENAARADDGFPETKGAKP